MLKLLNDKITLTRYSERHTFATRCLESGVSLKTVQKWLGHADFIITANIYSHINTDFEHEEISRFSDKIIELKSDRI